ncbi:MAG: hypothetical protein AB7S81_05470 [Bdellovibrionales bacterium]
MAETIESELISKYNTLMSKRNKLCVRRDSVERAIKEYESKLEDCFAAARLFGINLTPTVSDPTLKAIRIEGAVDKPTLREFVLAALKEQHPNSLKARQIQERYETLYGKIHDKTVGMTLYRLTTSPDGEVVRNGRDWSFVDKSQNQQNLGEK